MTRSDLENTPLMPLARLLSEQTDLTAALLPAVAAADADGTPLTPPRRITRRPEMIYTFGCGDSTCCIATQAGFSYGVNSAYARSICLRASEPRHRVVFVDNPYHGYDDRAHERHMALVRELRPRYATVRDMMTPEQCARDGVVYYEPSRILDWAEELRATAEQVIVIPKAPDYLALIPPHFLVGLPVPSRYGADTIPLDAWRARNDLHIHLLGGMWSRQLSYLYALGDQVVSLDTNAIQLLAKHGQYVDPAGQTHALRDLLPFATTNTLAIAFAISCGSIQEAITRLLA